MKVIDMHCDSITKQMRENKPLFSNDDHIDIERLLKADYAMQCFAMFAFLKGTEKPFDTCCKYIEQFKKQMKLNENYISQVFNYEQLIQNINNNKLSALLTIEEGATIEGSLDKLQYFYDQGVRMMTLTWNFENEIGYPNNNMVTGKKYNTEEGLKEFGFECVKKMNDLGIIVDTSHGSDKLFYDCIATSSKPIIASHSDARSIWDHPRNLTDDMIRVLADHGGMTGINFCPSFVSGNPNENQIPMLVEHIKHIINVGGYDVCGLGSDFDGIETPVGMSDCSKMPVLYEALKKAKFTDDQIEKIFYKNFLRVFEANCK